MLSFTIIDVKTGLLLPLPPKQADHTYLEHLLGGERVNAPDLKLAVGKLYEGVTESDLNDLRSQGLYLMLTSGQTAYFGDAMTAALVVGEQGLFQNHSDAVAYSLPVSEAAASLVTTQGRVLVIDDEAVDAQGKSAPHWGEAAVLLTNGQLAPLDLLQTAASRLGDGYTLLSPTQQRTLVEQSALDKLSRVGAIAITNAAISVEGQPTPEALQAPLSALLQETLGDVPLDLEASHAKRDGSIVVKWSTAGDVPGDVPQRGKALLTPSGEGTYQTTLVGGTEAFQITVNQSFAAFQQALQTPFQFRAGMTQWQGAMKGTCRSSELCAALGVEAIIPLSAIKGDAVKDGAKTVQAGIHDLDGALFWSYKTPAKTIQQRLGGQALVNLPEGTRTDVLPKIEARVADLAAAQSDPRLVADLYIQSYERRQDRLEADPEFDATSKRVDWLYEALKADARPAIVVTELVSEALAMLLEPETWQQLQDVVAQKLAVDSFVEQANAVLDNDPGTTSIRRLTVEEVINPPGTAGTYPTTFSTQQRGGYSQLIEHDKVVADLERFMQSEWEDVATGGVYVPCAVAQPHRALEPDEVCFKDLPHGAQVALYRSPVANVAAFDVFTNNLEALRTTDREAFQQQGVSYMNPETAKRLVIDFDGDRVAIIPAEEIQPTKTQVLEGLGDSEVFIPNLPHGQAVTLYHSGNQVSTFTNNTSLRETVEGELSDHPERLSQVFVPTTLTLNPDRPVQVGYYDGLHGYKRLHEEVVELNAPDRKPVQVEKEKKIPRNAANGFPTLASAALDASDNPTGAVANNGMKLEALRWDLQYTPDEQKGQRLGLVSAHAAKLLKDNLDPEKEFAIPAPTAKSYDFKAELQAISRSQTLITASDPAIKLEQVKEQLKRVDRFLFQVEGLNAVQLQRAVDTPKSARTVDAAEFAFCRRVSSYLDVGWVKEKNQLDLYLGGNTISVKTNDPVSWLVSATNAQYEDSQIQSQVNRCYRQLCPRDTFTPEQGAVAKAVASEYNSAITTSMQMEAVAKTETGPTLLLKTKGGREIKVTNLTVFDPSGKGPLWAAAKVGTPIDLEITDNRKGWVAKADQVGKSWQTGETHDYRVKATLDGKAYNIGTLSPQSVADLQTWQASGGKRGILLGTEIKDATPRLGIGVDKEDAKALRVAADATLHAWAETVPPADQAAYRDALWHNQGQKIAIKLFPEAMAERLAEFRLHETRAIGLQYDTNEWGADLPNGQVDIRMALETADNSNRGKAVIQIADGSGQWQSLGPVSSDFYQLPVGTTAKATIQPGSADLMHLTTNQGTVVTFRPLKNVPIAPTAPGKAVTVQFKYSLDKKAFVVRGDPPTKIGQLTPESVAIIKDIEQRSNSKIFNADIRRDVTVSVGSYKDAQLLLTDPVLPTAWCKVGDLEGWQALKPDQAVATSVAAPTVETASEAVPVVRERQAPVSPPLSLQPTNLTPLPNPTPIAAPTADMTLDPATRQLEADYVTYQARVKLVYEIMGNTSPTVQQVDAAIVSCIQQTVPKTKQGDALQCLQRSPNVLELKKSGYEAAIAYLDQVLAPMQVATPKVKAASLEH